MSKLIFKILPLLFILSCGEHPKDLRDNGVRQNFIAPPKQGKKKNNATVSGEGEKKGADKAADEKKSPQPEKTQRPNTEAAVHNLKKAPIVEKTHEFSKDDELDLHGKSVTKAKELFHDFLHQAKTLGKKFVLLITGKGKHSSNTYLLKDNTKVGSLKYHFLKWLQEGEYSSKVKDYSFAHGVHGGEGALYLELVP